MFTKLQIFARIFPALVILLIPDISIVQKTAGQITQPLPSQIDQYIQGQMTKQNIVGLSVAVVQNNEVTYLNGFGAASIKKKRKSPRRLFLTWHPVVNHSLRWQHFYSGTTV